MSLNRYRLKHKCLGKKPRYFRFRKTPFSLEKRAVFLTMHDVFSFDGKELYQESMSRYVCRPPQEAESKPIESLKLQDIGLSVDSFTFIGINSTK